MTKVPFNDLKRQTTFLTDELQAAVTNVVNSGWYVMGPEHENFELEFADYCGTAHAIGVGNGTDALELALLALDCGPGDEVITVANAGGYTTTACVSVGATPVYVDIDPESLTMSTESLATALSDKTKAVVVTHLYGQLADIDEILATLSARNIPVIEDCAQAHGATRNGKRAGSFGTLGTFSFYPTKNLGALGDGGAIATSDSKLANRLRELHQYGWTSRYQATTPRGRNSRLDEIQAAVLRIKLRHLDVWNTRRRDIAKRYAEVSGVSIIGAQDESFVAHLCIARHDDRDTIMEKLHAQGVDTAIHFPTLDCHQPAMKNQSWRAMPLNESENTVNTIFSLPCFPELADKEVDYVCKALENCY
jgi:dTDP-3-amino-2,3,6-trideoxy-4-keto-D-glucose/dTDP-3-amino-3,4,6-trideoxy-alpha-D-glucose/dTDP-2,6-dideoxy-D-kanosamine transaminase